MSRARRAALTYRFRNNRREENPLGKEGEGFKVTMRALQGGRATIGAKAPGIAIGPQEDAFRYANERIVKGSPIGKYEMIQGQIAGIAVAIAASCALVYQAVQLMDRHLPT